MKKLKKVVGLITALFFIGGAVVSLASCSNDDEDTDGGKNNASSSTGNGSGPEANEATYSITFKDFDPKSGVFSVAPGETKTLEVDTVKGTWKIDEANLPSEITVTKKADGNFEIKGGDAETTDNVSFKLYPDGVAENDTSYDVTIWCKVYDPKFTITLNLSDELAAKAKSISMKYDNSLTDSAKKEFDAEIEYTANSKTAKAKLLKENSNSYGYFSGISVTVKDASDSEIKTNLDKNAWVCWYSTNAEYYNVLNLTENSYAESDLTITFSGFTLSSTDSVVVTYGITADSNTKNVNAEISSDGASATAKIGNDHLNSTNWFEISVAITKGGETYTSFKTDGNGWYEWKSTGFAITVTDTSSSQTETWNTLYTNDFSGTGAFVKLEIETMPASITKLRAELANMDGSNWWFQINSDGETWDVLKAAYDASINGYSLETSDQTLISALISNGIYAVAGDGNTGTLIIKYQ